MPDLERITDKLRVDMAEIGLKARGKNADYWDGYRNGKSYARWEIVIVITAIFFIIAAIGRYAN